MNIINVLNPSHIHSNLYHRLYKLVWYIMQQNTSLESVVMLYKIMLHQTGYMFMEIYLQCSLNSAEKRDPGLSKSSAGVPNSLTCPCSITRILSEVNTVSTLQRSSSTLESIIMIVYYRVRSWLEPYLSMVK